MSGPRPPRGPRAPKPALKSLVLCDVIIQEAGTNKKSLVGIFHDITAATFPCFHPMMGLYANLADAAGEYHFEVRLVHLGTGEQIGRSPLPPVTVRDRLEPTEICVQIPMLKFPSAGKYEVQLHANGELVGSRDFTVHQVDQKPGAAAGQPAPPAEPPPDSWSPEQ